MYGRYTKDLGEYAKLEARKLKMLERKRKQEDKARDRVIYIFFLMNKKHINLIFLICLGTLRKTTWESCPVPSVDLA